MTWDLFQKHMQEQRYEWLREGMPEIAREMLNVQGKELRARLVF